MKFAENNNQAAEYLRQAVPLMVKHKIPPNPLNYALWYTYVSDRLPALNKQLDSALHTYGTCPNMLSEQMFRQHMIKEETEHTEKVQAGLVDLVNDLHSHADSAAQETACYSHTLESSLGALKDSSDGIALEQIINTLAQSTESICETTQQFQSRISEAQKEIEDLRAELEKTRQDASIDPLTNLFNRRVFDAELSSALNHTPEGGTAVVYADIDHFKRFNDNYGHLMGDKVLQAMGKLLIEHCSSPLLPSRLGGEEFAVLVPANKASKAMELCETIRKKIQAIRIKQKKSGEVISSITCSFGIAFANPAEKPTDLLERADQALYRAKDNGRNQTVVAD
ncbi:MAG: GGDEF domain-containing protein [Pontibacterium sp.]